MFNQVASTVDFPCKYASSGCTVTLRYSHKPEHEETCEYRPYSCPCPGASCKWQGTLDAVMPHLMTAHKSITNLQVNQVCFVLNSISSLTFEFLKQHLILFSNLESLRFN